jgi:hypothetical protein
MIAPGAGSQPQKTNWDWSTAGQLVFSGLAVLISLSFALLLAGSALLLQGSQQGGSTEALPMMTMAWSLALVGALVIPSAVLALLRLAGHPLRAWPAGLLKGAHRILPWMILAWLIVLAAGYGISLLTGCCCRPSACWQSFYRSPGWQPSHCVGWHPPARSGRRASSPPAWW